MIYFLYGKAGVGKNFVGLTLAKHFGFYFWDADEALLPEMKDAIHHKVVFTLEMRDIFTNEIIKKIKALQLTHKNLIVAQALYKNSSREQIQKAFPDMKLILIDTTRELMLQRLKQRNNDVDQVYAEKIFAEFESPKDASLVIHNNSNENSIISQFQQYFKNDF